MWALWTHLHDRYDKGPPIGAWPVGPEYARPPGGSMILALGLPRFHVTDIWIRRAWRIRGWWN